ncbi:MAG: histidinol dehydrogenase [Dehalococcoidia bacterium]|nr:histidinol dehydrogenase [Dehalococcoidia bacterium]MDW8119611.1 histidinol dehydrogenase [Chloroflexota bacterium]
MRIVKGYDNGKAALTRRPLGDYTLPPEASQRLAEAFGSPLTVREAVERILADVRQHGDTAVRFYTERLDKVPVEGLEVSPQACQDALHKMPRRLRSALETAWERAVEYHTACLPRSWVDFQRGWGEMFVPMERVGIYIPGGTAIYPSTVIMTVVPALVAGVDEVILCTPPRPDGPHPWILGAAALAGATRVFQIGGAQAIAAMAFGTSTVPKVDMVCGPGNIFVTLAKQMVFGVVGVDGLYGPTETVIIADATATPAYLAADLLAQAEHDPLASPILITTHEALVHPLLQEIERQQRTLPRAAITAQALRNQGLIILVDSLEEALDLANFYAPEHLCLAVADPWRWVSQVYHAGGVFVGEDTPETLGDYLAGPSHVMPTGGTARFASALSVHHFLKAVCVVASSPEQMASLAHDTMTLARAEGLDGHSRAIQVRLKRWRTHRP